MSDLDVYGFSLVPPLAERDQAGSIEDALDMIALADRCGLDGWFIAEHHGQDQLSLSSAPSVLLAAAGQRTSRLRLGAMAWVLPFHHPVRLAEELVTLDAVLGGRLEVGVGRGHLRDEQKAFGVERHRATEMFDESLQVIVELLAGQAVSPDSEWWRGDGATLVPAPTRDLPMWLTAVSEESIDKAARLGFSCATALLPRPEADARLGSYRAAWERHRPGTPCGRFAITASVAVASSRDEAIEMTREQIERRQSHFSRAIVDTPDGADPTYEGHRGTFDSFAAADFTAMIDDGLLIAGDVDACREQVRQIRDRGVDALICTFSSPEHRPDFARETMQRFAAEVLDR